MGIRPSVFVGAALLLPAVAFGQLQTSGTTSHFGRVKLAPGFEPDPHTVSVKSGGNVDVSTLGLGGDCTGYVTSVPDFILDLTGTSDRLSFLVEAPGDTSLVVNGADGRWYCNDDAGGARNPLVTIQNAEAGQYDVWVGSYNADEEVTGTIKITERAVGPTGGGQLETGGSSANFGRVELAAGFEPDPHRVAVTSGGSIAVSGLGLAGGCTGHVTARPDFILDLTRASDMLRFKVEASGDTSLIVNAADGRWFCDDDSGGGVNPMVSIANAGEGQYDVWIGSFEAGAEIPGTLLITERNPTPRKGG